jgi:predicted SAM-dependent methyltransferase
MDFDKFMTLEKKYLNLGSLGNTHPSKNYMHYVGVNPPGRFQNKIVDLNTGELVCHPDSVAGSNQNMAPKPFALYHDLETPFPLPDNSVDRIHSEDCFEHIELSKYPQILSELYRILKPGGTFRLAVPDYLNPKDRFCLDVGFDPRNNLHVTLTTYAALKPVLDASPFTTNFLHYWRDPEHWEGSVIDYSKGHVKRTPDNDERNTPACKLHVTSLVVDLTK